MCSKRLCCWCPTSKILMTKLVFWVSLLQMFYWLKCWLFSVMGEPLGQVTSPAFNVHQNIWSVNFEPFTDVWTLVCKAWKNSCGGFIEAERNCVTVKVDNVICYSLCLFDRTITRWKKTYLGTHSSTHQLKVSLLYLTLQYIYVSINTDIKHIIPLPFIGIDK